ncbi:OmpA family protein [Arenibacter sp. GZD-96]|uniref:OmpA family protein n=1 Tax=Aurantibrevibacter litoralis TaxID=3106030 RepID=UPI002AFF2D86|nr:OmpA family protein [Arenibacter sp. GZD-96]
MFLWHIAPAVKVYGAGSPETMIAHTENSVSLPSLAFEREAKRHNIRFKSVKAIDNAAGGYYTVAGVFGNPENKNKALNRFKALGFSPGFIHDTKKKLYYVYLSYYASGMLAIEDCASHYNGKYSETVWILNIANQSTSIHRDNKDSLSVAFPDAQQEPTADTSIAAIASVVEPKNDPKYNKLIAKANSYFEIMWYAEAAKLYEEALKDNHNNAAAEIVERVGDAHYFNTNVERAYYWYTLLYENYEDNRSSNTIFKYAQTLKAAGKYTKAKRLMRLFDRQKESTNATKDAVAENVVLDELLLDNAVLKDQKFEIKNLDVNSKYSDFSPAFYDTDALVFASSRDSLFLNTRRYKWNDQPYLDLYVGKINEETQEVKSALKFSKKINSKYHEASVTFSPDNTTMYFTRNNYGKKLRRDSKGINHLKIYRSKKVNGEWTEATEMPFNSDAYSTGHPALSPDGKILYFVSDMPGSLGKTDIFMVDILDNGTYSNPKNLGPKINTEQQEMFPFVTPEKLYFASDGHDGYGGLDVYQVALPDEDGFGEVFNLGTPINSNRDDFSYIVDEATQKGFFASNRDGGKGDDDIYSFQKLLPEETSTHAIEGVITALETGETMPRALITLLDENNIKIKELHSNEDGSFMFEDLESNTKYTLQITAEGYDTETRVLQTAEKGILTENVALRKLHEEIIVEEGIRKFKTEHILFDFDRWNIKNEAAAELEKLVRLMSENPNMVIKIESHTDSRGSKEYNKYLSDKRAKATRDYIISKGIATNRIESAIGYGEARLLNECDGSIRCTEKQHLRNRRSEFIIVHT